MCANYYYIMSFGLCLKKLHLVKVSAFAWCSVKICVIFGVRCERRNVDKKANLHENGSMQTILEYFEYFCQMSSKSIFIILSYTVSKLVRFFSETQCTILFCCLLITLLSFCCRPLCCFHFGHMYSFYNCFFLYFFVFYKGSHKCTW